MKKITSLATFIKDDPSLAIRIKEVAKEVEKDSAKIKNISAKYNEKYQKEIQEGTIKKHLLLEDGKRRGKTVEEIEMSSGFIPTIYTPILNWLYYMVVLEGRDLEHEMKRERQNKEFGLLQEEVGDDVFKKAPDMEEYIYGNLTYEKFQTLKKLKRLSKSPNEHEAFAAYRKCLEMCKEHRIDFDKIPN